jgi:hypothetical protein
MTAARKTPGIERRVAAHGVSYRARIMIEGTKYQETFATLVDAEDWLLARRRFGPPPIEGSGGESAPAIVLADVATSRRNAPRKPVRMTYGQIVERWFPSGAGGAIRRDKRGRPYAAISIKMDSELYVRVIEPLLGNVTVDTVSLIAASEMLEGMARRHGVEAAKKVRSFMNRMQRFAAAERWSERRVFAGDFARDVPARPPVERIISPDELPRFTSACRVVDAIRGRSLMFPLFELAADKGPRPGEILAALWGPAGIDLRRGVFTVPHGKTHKAARTLRFNPNSLAALENHWHECGCPPDGTLAFTDGDGRSAP